MKAEAYPHFTNKKTAPQFLPDFSADSALDIDFAQLKKMGVKHILFDLDLTIRAPRAKQIEAAVITYLVQQHEAGMFKTLNLATNNMHDVSAFSQPLNATVFQPFLSKGRLVRKPKAEFFERILTQLKAQPHEVAMVGDKVRYDVGGGNSMGMVTILMKPQGKDLFHDKLLFIRTREKRLLKSARAALEIAKAVQS